MIIENFDYEAHLERCARRDEPAFDALYNCESSRMLGLAAKMLGRRDEAEEILHDAFVQIWDNADRFDRTLGSGRAWMYSILRYRVLSRLRRRDEIVVDDEVIHAVADDAPGPEGLATEAQGVHRLDRCLDYLEDDRRGPIMLAYYQGLSHGQIAQKLATPLGTIKSRIRAGLRALQECLSA
ncbi:sigma-70 family RNA polymerase sigma factor [Schauerella aestuarii]|uniref:sigma-70 family RNA polymerase sigma factor n=1 Tax=Schauerella aestuarii TaxID=2511204 RepID=UPI0013698C28|nr:sigma-70 family RNA polymerase sigma factor [Achromobacter aestuarii]MYZ46051.1 sigma-70 family RNA polymerase sigma factor [Achromobacter aestuarii]